MLTRRRFVTCIAAAAATPALTGAGRPQTIIESALTKDAAGLLDLPQGFSYSVISRIGTPMSDGLLVPGSHDGMAAFRGEEGLVVLICNHELHPRQVDVGAFGPGHSRLTSAMEGRVYDRGSGKLPGLGGTTTILYDPRTHNAERQFMSLAGTELNCAGGPTPWGSWLSCEECFESPRAAEDRDGGRVNREKRHGYVFEVPADAKGLVEPVPLTDMGRFEHEAAAVHSASGIVYLTEDRWHSLLYRFVPNARGQLHKGGRLQALAIAGQPGKKTHNWEANDMRVGDSVPTHWIDLHDVDGDNNDLRQRGAADGAATFARGEGITWANDRFAFTCTIGGPARLGQVFTYKPSPQEGTELEHDAPGQLALIAEADTQSLLKNCDNLTMAPWGDLILCEDTVDATDRCALIGFRPDGSQYPIANNAYSDSELAGVCFSPDGLTMFVNIQYPGTTVAITGPWMSLAN